MAQVQREDGMGWQRLASTVGRKGASKAIWVCALAVISLCAVCTAGIVYARGPQTFVVDRMEERDASSLQEVGDEGRNAPNVDETSGSLIVVDVSGAVEKPTVVELPEGARVYEAIEAAGGVADDADLSALNRAAILSDGEKVYVPTSQETSGTGSEGSEAVQGSTLVNINLAGIDELDTLPGIGPATAQAIVEDREANGRFASTEDLMRVSGIGEKKFEKLASLICA